MKANRATLIGLLSVVVACCASNSYAKDDVQNIHDQKEIVCQHPEVMSLIEKANQLISSGKPEEALNLCNKAIGACPYLGLAYATLSSIHGMLGQYQDALKDADRSVELDPNSAIAYSNKGLALYAIGESEKSKVKVEEALKNFSKAISLDSEHANDYVDQGKCYFFLGQMKESQQDFNRAISLNPKLATAYRRRAKTLDKLGHHESAVTDRDKVKSLGYRE